MISRTIFPRRRGRRPLLGMAIAGLSVALLTVAGLALAVHDLNFQLDGDTTTTDQTPGSPGTPALDWDSLFNANGTNTSTINPANDPGFTHGDFVRDFRSKAQRSDSCTAASALTSQGLIFCTNDTTTFATGSKDILPISGWQCNADNNVNSKIDIMNAYAASYRAANGDRIIYFGLDKNKDNGNNNVGFWFLQGNANCDATNGTATWTGAHTDGDVLVVSEFTNGGGVSGITAYQWAGGADGCIDSDGDATRCDGLSFGQGGDCKATPGGGDNICATTNSGPTEENDAITTNWLTADATVGVGHTVVPPDFFEGAINITKIFSESGSTAPSCFNTFVGDTRSSQELTATLFDYARGQLGECAAAIATQAKVNGTNTNGTVTPGTVVTDTATITGTSSGIAPYPSSDEATGGHNVFFYICEQLAGTGDCTSTATPVPPALGAELTPTATQGVSTATSGGYDTTGKAPGRYCFYAVWAGDSNYTTGASGGAAATECFTIAGTTSGSSQQNWLPNDRVVVSTPTGTVPGTLSIQLFEGTLGSTCAASTGTLRYTEPVPNSGAFTATVAGAAYDTTNGSDAGTAFKATSSNSYFWKITFTPTSSFVTGFTICESTSLTITNDPVFP